MDGQIITEILCEIVYRIQVEIIFFKFITELFVSLMEIMCASSSEVVQYILLVVKFWANIVPDFFWKRNISQAYYA